MAVYLKSLPPQPGDTDPREVPQRSATVLERGGKLYEQHCAACHGEQGKGVPAPIRRCAGNRAVTMPVTQNLVQVVLHGGFPPATRGIRGPSACRRSPPRCRMPTWRRSDLHRASWGTRAAPVSELAVAQQRSSSAPPKSRMALRPATAARVSGQLGWAHAGRFESWLAPFEAGRRRTGAAWSCASPPARAGRALAGLPRAWWRAAAVPLAAVPMRNFGLPEDPAAFRRDIARSLALQGGEAVLLHCAAASAATGTAAACLLKALGMDAGGSAAARARSRIESAERGAVSLVHWF
jgi:hypothetical protein